MDSIFRFATSPLELFVRGSLVFWFIFLLFRFVLRREAGSVGLADILLVVLIADAAQNGMSGEYKSVGEAFVLIGTIAWWNYLIDWLAFRYPWFASFAEPRIVPLIRHGRVLKANLRHEMLTEDELESQMRQQGVEDPSEVKHASLEPDGTISVIRYSRNAAPQHPHKGRPGAA